MVCKWYWSLYQICFLWIWCWNFQILAPVLGYIIENSWIIVCIQYYPSIPRKSLLLINIAPLKIIKKLKISVIILPVNIIILGIRRGSVFNTQSNISLRIVVDICLIKSVKSNTILIQCCVIAHAISYGNLWTLPILNILKATRSNCILSFILS